MSHLINPYRFGGPRAADPYWQNVVFYLGLGTPGSAPVDVSPAGRAVTVYGSPTGFVADSGVAPGLSSYEIKPGTDSRNTTGFSIAPSAPLNLDGDFTVEMWVWHDGAIFGDRNCFFFMDATNVLMRLQFNTAPRSFIRIPLFYYNVVPDPGWDIDVGSGAGRFDSTELTFGKWHHWAYERTGSTLRMYENGQPMPTTGTSTGTYDGTIFFGRNLSSTVDSDMCGRIGGVRITKGVARWQGAPFVPTFTGDGWMTDQPADFSGSAHKFWRVRVSTDNGASIQTREVEMRGSVGGASLNDNAAVPAFVDAIASATAAQLGNHWSSLTAWTAPAGLPNWVYVDLKQAVAARHLRLVAGGNPAPTAFTLAYSDDAISWTNVTSYSGLTWRAFEVKSWHLPDVGAHRYWRITATAAQSGTTFGLINFGLGTSGHSIDWAMDSRRFGVMEDTNFGTPMLRAFDGAKIAGSSPVYSSVTRKAYVGQRFLSAVDVPQLLWCAGDVANRTPQAGVVQFSNDGLRWQTDWSFSGQTGWGTEEQRVITRP